jgi:CHASE2 domain-containing sensor protein
MSGFKSIRQLIFREQAMNRETAKRFILGFAVLLLTLLAQLLLQTVHFFDHYDRSDADYFAQAMPVPAYSNRITIVEIDDNDYRSLFKSQSPLPNKPLTNLILTIETYRPRVVGLDFITADWPTPAPKGIVEIKPPVVWARDGSEVNGGELPAIVWNGVAGYSRPPAGLCFASPLFAPDSDGTVRHYTDTITAREPDQFPSSNSEFPSMAWVLASTYPDKNLDCQPASKRQSKLIRFSGENHSFRILHAVDVLADSQSGRYLSEYLKDRIVLIGGSFSQEHDRYPTSGGYLYGVELLAHATESDISGPIYELSPAVSLAIGTSISVIAYSIVFWFRYPLDLLVSVFLFLLLSFPTAWLAYSFGNVMVPIASSILALPIGIVCEHIVECPLRDFRRNPGKTISTKVL